jgi:hypothetical protein
MRLLQPAKRRKYDDAPRVIRVVFAPAPCMWMFPVAGMIPVPL